MTPIRSHRWAGLALLLLLAGCEEDTVVYFPTAADFGVTDPDKAALVLFDAADHYDITRVDLICEDGSVRRLESVPHDGRGVYPLDPGRYAISVRWMAGAGDPPRYICNGVYTKRFVLGAQDVRIYSLSGGTPCGHRIVPPGLE